MKFYHPDETLTYHIRKSFCKVVFMNNQNTLVVEIESDDDLDHVEEDSYQNDYPQIFMNIDDFAVSVKSVNQLAGKVLQIPNSEERENESGEIDEVYYTNLNINDEEDLETHENEVKFGKDDRGNLKMLWTGICDDFITRDSDPLKFKVSCLFSEDENDDEETDED